MQPTLESIAKFCYSRSTNQMRPLYRHWRCDTCHYDEFTDEWIAGEHCRMCHDGEMHGVPEIGEDGEDYDCPIHGRQPGPDCPRC